MRYAKIAAAAAAFLFLSTMSVAMFSTPAGRAEVKAEGPVPQTPLERWYFPAQYVNQASEIEEPVQEYF